MATTAHRDELIVRVERLLERDGFDRATIGFAVDRVLAALPDAGAPQRIVSLAAEHAPDFASRFRHALGPAHQQIPFGVAHHGRHTVVCCRVEGDALAHCTAVGVALGARVQVHPRPT